MSRTIEIKGRSDGAVLFAFEATDEQHASDKDMRHALEAAAIRRADLRGAALSGADLSGADLRGANLRDADLCDADLRGAALSGADLRGADLRGANLRDADLCDADLRGADLRDADLRGAALSGADLSGANLSRFRDDVWAVLSSAPAEASAVLAALQAGRVDGTVYLGDCACLVGTIAKARGCHYTALGVLKPDGLRLAETWFMQIRPGHTPANNGPTRLAAEWVGEWLASMRSAFGAQPSDGSQA